MTDIRTMQRETIDMTPTWAATLRIYGTLLQQDNEHSHEGMKGLMEAANHLDNTYPELCKELRARVEELEAQNNTLINRENVRKGMQS